jgi:ketosteroid isomerase-like protein
MKTIYVLIASGLILLISCQKQRNSLTDDQKRQIADSARQVAQQVVDLSNKLDFNGVLELYSNDPEARYSENGSTFPSLDAMRESYIQLKPILELVDIKADRWDIVVLSKDVVAITLPTHFKIKANGLSEYNGQYVWSAIIRKENGKWTVFQTHESWLNYAEAMAAIIPPTTDNPK